MGRKIFLIVSTFILLVISSQFYRQNKESFALVRSFGPLNVYFPSFPMFNESNWWPGKTVKKSLIIENTSGSSQEVAVKALEVSSPSSSLAKTLSIIISQNGTPIFGEGSLTGKKYLSDFYRYSEVSLGKLSPSEKKTFDFKIMMDEEAGNEHQGKTAVFDLAVGIKTAERKVPTLAPLPTMEFTFFISPLPTLRPFRPLNLSR